MFKMLIKILGLLLLCAGVFICYVYEQFGKAPSERELRDYEKLAYFKNGQFVSPQTMTYFPERTTGGDMGFKRFFFKSPYAPQQPYPKVMLDARSFPQRPEPLAAYWLGHSSLILELNGKRLLVDPVLGSAAPIPGIVKRYDKAPIQREDLPPADYVLITHNHYDHLERATIRTLRNKNMKFIAPLGVGAALRGWGVASENIVELGWGESYQSDELAITADPTVHYSNRQRNDRNKTLWNSYILQGGGKRVYISGDTGYDEQLFKTVGKTYGPFDLAFIEIDGWNPGWPNTHLFPAQAVQLAKDVRAKAFIPTHWGVFDLALHPWDESIREVVRLSAQEEVNVLTPKMGEKVIPGQTQTELWFTSKK